MYECSVNLLYDIKMHRFGNLMSLMNHHTSFTTQFPISFIYQLNKTHQCLHGSAISSYACISNRISDNAEVLPDNSAGDQPFICGKICIDKAVNVQSPPLANATILNKTLNVGIFSMKTNSFIGNTFSINCFLDLKHMSEWKFSKNAQLSSLFASFGSQYKNNSFMIYIIFELTIAIMSDNERKEVSCGWAAINAMSLNEKASMNLEVFNGSIFTQTYKLSEQNLSKKKKLTSYISIDILPYAKLTDKAKQYASYLPNLCIGAFEAMPYYSLLMKFICDRLIDSHYDINSFISDTICKINIEAFNSPDTVELLLPFIQSEIANKAKASFTDQIAVLRHFSNALFYSLGSKNYQMDKMAPFISSHGTPLFEQRRKILVNTLNTVLHKNKYIHQ